MNDKIQQILVVAATVAMIVLNWLAAVGILGGVETGIISDRYPTRITPAGYAFAIWSLIYAGMLAFAVYQALPSQAEKFRPVRRVYMLSCAANGVWLYIWSQEAILLALGVIVILLASLAFINIKLQKTETNAEYWLAKAPFGLYFGWVTAATILNASVALVYLGVSTTPSAAAILSAVLILVAAALGLIVRFMTANYFYPLAIAWALTAIAVKQSGQTVIVAAAAAGVIACLIASVSFVMDMPSSRDERSLR